MLSACTGILYEVNTEPGAFCPLWNSRPRVQHARGSHSNFPRAFTRPAFYVWEIRGRLREFCSTLTSSTTDNVALLRPRTPVTAARKAAAKIATPVLLNCQHQDRPAGNRRRHCSASLSGDLVMNETWPPFTPHAGPTMAFSHRDQVNHTEHTSDNVNNMPGKHTAGSSEPDPWGGESQERLSSASRALGAERFF